MGAMCDMRLVSVDDKNAKPTPEGGDCQRASGTAKEKEKREGLSFINSPAVVETPCWTVNHQWPPELEARLTS